jgi:hypothetical protein
MKLIKRCSEPELLKAHHCLSWYMPRWAMSTFAVEELKRDERAFTQ